MNNGSFKYKVALRRINRTVSRNKRKVQFPNAKKLNTVAIVGDNFKLDLLKKKFDADLVYLNIRNEKRDKSEVSEDIFWSDLNFWNLPPERLIAGFTQRPCDVLINFNTESNTVVDFICAKSVAKFKISKYQQGQIFDLVIDQHNISDTTYVDEIIKTITNFRNHE